MKTIEERAKKYGIESANLLCSDLSEEQRERQAEIYAKVYSKIATEQKAIDDAERKRLIKHTNDWHWGTDVSFIAADGMAHIAVSFQSDRQFGWIHDLYVHPDARRKGYATRLLTLAEQEVRERGMNAVRLMVEYDRKFVWDWYKRNGYTDDYDGQTFTDKYTELQKLL